MFPLMLAAALLAESPPSNAPVSSLGVGELYDSCALFTQLGEAARDNQPRGAALCDAVATMELAALDAMAQLADDNRDHRTFCPPESVLNSVNPSQVLAQAFIAHVDRNPADLERDSIGVFAAAMAAKWPCPR